jgi:hypothetical protein
VPVFTAWHIMLQVLIYRADVLSDKYNNYLDFAAV